MLVVATVSCKLRKTKRGEERQRRFDTVKLNNSNTEKAFKLELNNRFHVLQEEQEMNIDRFDQVLSETSKTLLRYRKTRKEEWIKTDTWKIKRYLEVLKSDIPMKDADGLVITSVEKNTTVENAPSLTKKPREK